MTKPKELSTRRAAKMIMRQEATEQKIADREIAEAVGRGERRYWYDVTAYYSSDHGEDIRSGWQSRPRTYPTIVTATIAAARGQFNMREWDGRGPKLIDVRDAVTNEIVFQHARYGEWRLTDSEKAVRLAARADETQRRLRGR